MTFLSGGFLTGLALTAVPVVIHLIIRRRRKLVPWGAMQFLMGTPPRFRQRLLKLNELLVLLLRMLAIAAVVLAFAQPLMLSRMLARRADERILIIDASLSTSRKVATGETAFAGEIAAAEKAFDSLGGQDTVRILVACDAPRWLTPAPLEATSSNRDALRAMLKALRPTEGGSDMALAIAEALQSLPAPNCNSRRILIFSDATDKPWHPDELTRWKAIGKAAKAAALPTSIEIAAAIPPNLEALTNFAIDRLSTDHDTIAAGDAVLLTAQIRNHGGRTSTATEVVWQLDGKAQGTTALPPLGSGTSATIEFSMPCGEAGSHVITASLAARDDLPADSTAIIAIRTLDEIPLLVVDGKREPASEEASETGFLLAALGRLPGAKEPPRARAAFQPKVIDPSELSTEDFKPYLCVVLANVQRVEPQVAVRLAAHVATGGGLWMALGDRTDAEQFNQVFSSADSGLSPVQLGSIVSDTRENKPGWRILPPVGPHPATMFLSDSTSLDLEKARVGRHFALLAPVPADLGCLLTLETQAPLVMEHSFGKGRVLIQTVPINREWNNLPILQVYVPMVREFLWRLVDGRVSSRNLSPGETLRLAASARPEAPFTINLPDGQTISGSAVEGEVHFSNTFLPGLYKVDEATPIAEFFSVPRPSEESDLTPLKDDTRRFLAGHGVALETADAHTPPEAVAVNARRSMAPALLLAALVFFLLEALLAWLFARQHTPRHRPVELTPATMR